MSNENPTPERNNKPGRRAATTLIQAAFPEKPTVVFFTALVIGLLLIAMTMVFRSYFTLNYMQENLVLCLGVGLVLAAFGGQATVRIGGIIMVGVAAITLGLFIYLQRESHDMFLQGRIGHFDSDTYQSLQIRQQDFILGRVVANNINPKRSHYDFAIFKRESQKGDIFTVELVAKTQKERVIEVRAAHFKPAFGRPEMLDWELREEDEGSDKILSLFDRSTGTRIAREGDPAFGKSATTRTPIGPILINAAFAQEKSAIDVPLMLKRLEADDAATRRGARDALSRASVDFIPTMMKTFLKEDVSYREKLGICVVLAEMLRADKHQAAAIRSKLNGDDLKRMVDAAGDPDRTVRVYAAEFLFDLGDKRTPKLAIQRAAETSDDNARYNWLLVSQSGWGELSAAEKEELEPQLKEAKRRSGQKTQQLFKKLQK